VVRNREALVRSFLILVPLLGALLAACSPPAPVDEIVASNLAARGGRDRIRALRSIRETATATASGGRVARVVREIKRPGFFRLEFSYQGPTSVFKLKLTLEGGAIRYDYVDVASRQVVRADVTRTIRGRPVELQNTFSDFREVGGIVFPYLIETRAKDRPEVIRIEVEKIELDPDLDDARFRLP
jgi:hypothetical protein